LGDLAIDYQGSKKLLFLKFSRSRGVAQQQSNAASPAIYFLSDTRWAFGKKDIRKAYAMDELIFTARRIIFF
jgi:hypothetical protein